MTFDIINFLILAIGYAARAYELLILASVILSWVRPDPYNPVVRFIRRSTEPVIDFVRRSLPFLRAGMIDFSPIVVLLLLRLVSTLLVSLLQRVAEQL
jgi:YggT family protein